MWIKLDKTVLFGLICCLSLPGLCFAQAKVTIEHLEKLLNEDRIEEALQLLPPLRNQYPNHSTVLYLTGLDQENGESAFQYYSRVFEHHKDSDYADDSLFRIAQLYYARGKYDVARTYFSRLARSYPQSRLKDDSQYLFCQSYFAQGKLDSAATFLKTFIKNSSRSPYVDLAIMDLESPSLAEKDEQASPGENRLLPQSMYRYSVQIGAFSNKDNARKVYDRLTKAGYSVEVMEKRQEGRKLYAVWLSKFETKALARNFAEKFYKKYSMDYKIVDRNE